jgi:hypothetical protein
VVNFPFTLLQKKTPSKSRKSAVIFGKIFCFYSTYLFPIAQAGIGTFCCKIQDLRFKIQDFGFTQF